MTDDKTTNKPRALKETAHDHRLASFYVGDGRYVGRESLKHPPTPTPDGTYRNNEHVPTCRGGQSRRR